MSDLGETHCFHDLQAEAKSLREKLAAVELLARQNCHPGVNTGAHDLAARILRKIEGRAQPDEREVRSPAVDALRHLLAANKLFEQPDFVHDPDTEWERAMIEAEAVLSQFPSTEAKSCG